ncbi:DUF481 domain-containing protein [Pelagicoccus sp. SDUM812002]|uniref:DUF481 domain-containing protein n=1 Tax=Pelagicoccus sp. SDUM812002 TaxID=3041266 RepID=UPI00280CE8BA|nr:DUF481 domain-containing protein [Pelagicoccus sp. SDUM812002]MDQ8187643.1 DUF481 domain-containing protein [Pelagicoccus sp. SDUM812002]
MKLFPVLSVVAALLASTATADTIVTTGGSTINGKILGIDGGKISVKTDFAGKIIIDQKRVESITTDDEVSLSLEDGTVVQGPVSGQDGTILVQGANGNITSTISAIDETWMPGQKSPTEIAAERKWAYEAAFDLTGKNGNRSSTGLGSRFRATLDGEQDTLAFFARVNYQEVDDEKSADEARGGVDYSNKFGKHYNWYVRTEFGYDAIKEIDQFFTVSAGFGYVFTDTDTRKLSIRAGLGYLSENYGEDTTLMDVGAASFDLGLSHKETFEFGTWTNRATYTPTLEDFGNFRLIYDTSFDFPLKSDAWSVRTGVNFDYNSEVEIGDEELDTTYYIRMVLKWL